MSEALLPGKRLQSARKSQSMSEQDVARKLHLSVTVVKALESDDYERLPEPAFVKGYIRNYARLVGLPADEVANLYQQIAAEQQTPVQQASPTGESQATRSVWMYAVVAVVVAVLVWAALAWSPESSVMTSAADAEATSAAIDDLQLDQIEQSSASDIAMPIDAEAEAEVEPEMAAPEVEEPSPPALDRLSMVFSETCWLRVVDAKGEEIYSGQKPSESRFLIQGEGPFRITLGNAAAVSEIDVNGTRVPVPVATPGRVVTVRTP